MFFLVLTPDFFLLQFKKLPSFKNLSDPTVNQTEFINATMQLPQ